MPRITKFSQNFVFEKPCNKIGIREILNKGMEFDSLSLHLQRKTRWYSVGQNERCTRTVDIQGTVYKIFDRYNAILNINIISNKIYTYVIYRLWRKILMRHTG